MQTEIEAKFLDVDHDEIRNKLKKLGAKLEHPMRLMRRVVFDKPDGGFFKVNGQRLRVRDEGNKITVTLKTNGASKYDSEIELQVDSFETAIKLIEGLGFNVISYQESKRETWQYDQVEIVLDEWPWLKPYIEVEGKNESEIKSFAQHLGFNWEDAKFGSVDTAYMAQYPKMTTSDSIGNVDEVKFDLPLPKYLIERKLNLN